MSKSVSRNDPCPCGSGKKYKQCCLGKPPAEERRRRAVLPVALILLGILAGVYIGVTRGIGGGLAAGFAGVLFAGMIIMMRDPPPPTGGKGDAASINFGS